MEVSDFIPRKNIEHKYIQTQKYRKIVGKQLKEIK